MTAVRMSSLIGRSHRPAANAARTSASRATSVVDVRRLVGAVAEPLDRGLEQARDPGEAERPVEEARDRDVVGGDQRGRRALADPTGLAGDPEGREARLVRGAEVEPAGRDEVDRGRRRGAAVGIGQGVLDRGAHVRGAQLGLQGAVHEADR